MGSGTAQLLPPPGPDVLSIAGLLDQVQAAITRAFPRGQLVWVRGEVQAITDRTGHCYIDLVDPDAPRGRDARVLKVNCWQRTWAPMKAALAGQGITLEVGTVVTLRGRGQSTPRVPRSTSSPSMWTSTPFSVAWLPGGPHC